MEIMVHLDMNPNLSPHRDRNALASGKGNCHLQCAAYERHDGFDVVPVDVPTDRHRNVPQRDGVLAVHGPASLERRSIERDPWVGAPPDSRRALLRTALAITPNLEEAIHQYTVALMQSSPMEEAEPTRSIALDFGSRGELTVAEDEPLFVGRPVVEREVINTEHHQRPLLPPLCGLCAIGGGSCMLVSKK